MQGMTRMRGTLMVLGVSLGLAACDDETPMTGDDAAVDAPVGDVGGDAPVVTDAPVDRPPGQDAGDVPVITDVPVVTDATDVPVGMDVTDVPVGMDVVDVPAVTDVTDAGPDVVDASSPTPGAPTAIARATAFEAPLDAVLTATGSTTFFLARDAQRQPTLFRMMVGGASPSAVTLSGVRLTFPTGLAISADDATIYIADQAADRGVMGLGEMGALLAVSAEGGAATAISIGTLQRPRAVAVHGTPPQLTFLAFNEEGAPVLARVPAVGGTATALVTGAPLVDPSALTVASDGTVYVTDARGAGPYAGTVLRVPSAGGTPTVLYRRARMGSPAGIALSRDERSLLVAMSDPETGPGLAIWLPVDGMSPRALSTFGGTSGLVSPTGVHRARNADVFVVADDTAADATATGFGAVFTAR